MLDEQEKKFYDYWETRRLQKRKWFHVVFDSLPRGLLFALPIILFFMFEAPRHKDMISATDLVLICIGTVSIAFFYSIFSAHFRWERNEEKYQALKRREELIRAGSPR